VTKTGLHARWIFLRTGLETAAAATRNVNLWQPSLQTFNCLKSWLQKHGHQLQVLQLYGCSRVALTSLPCAQLQNLVLNVNSQNNGYIYIGSRVWSDIAAATKLTSVSMELLQTASQQTDVVSALTALPDLQQLTWRYIQCSGEQKLSDSLLLQHLTKLTALDLQGVSAAAFKHLGSLTKLQNLGAVLQRAGLQRAALDCRNSRPLPTLS